MFKSIRVLAREELRSPGSYQFPAYASGSFLTIKKENSFDLDLFNANNNEQLETG